MRTEAEIRRKGMEALLKELGDIDTKIFIRMLISFDIEGLTYQKKIRNER